ncbi:hydantoinase B/oxoprolinase family protein [Mesorhizobium sp. M1329]|uniref:hydantoinase B/oxoprolinase family protein n=1 Tax=Mesorhizobium sp. M1329 TaxID=2957083 RepID=UPI00333C9A8A
MKYSSIQRKCAFCGKMLARVSTAEFCDKTCETAGAKNPLPADLPNALANWLKTDCYSGETSVDAITLEVINGALLSICKEMAKTMERTAYSPVFYEGADLTTAIYDADLTLIAQYEGIPAQMGSMKFAVEAGVDHVGKENLQPNDAILFNDSYHGTPHLPEFCMIIPVFHNGEIVAYSATIAHHTDVGGKSPGSMPADATEIYQEGVIIPPVKFIKAGKEDPELWEVMLANVRTPLKSYGDAMAMYASTRIGERRVLELVEQHGRKRFQELCDEVRRYAERRMRASIRSIPNGIYEGTVRFDYDGVTTDPTVVRLSLIVLDEDIIFDYRGSDRQARGPVNSPYGVAYSASANAVFNVVDPYLNHNQGTFAPLHAILPRGSIVNCMHPAPLSGGQSESHNALVEGVLDALRKAIPDRAPAPGGSSTTQLTGGGRDEHGEPYTFITWEGSGWGGLRERDGTTAVMAWVGVGSKTFPAEVLETHYPWRVRKRELRPDSGAGEFRGGLGVATEYEILVDDFQLNSVSWRGVSAPAGFNGGEGGQITTIRVLRDGKEYTPLELGAHIVCLTQFSALRLRRGDRLRVCSPGGAGYGNVADRDPALIERDLIAGYITPAKAIESYRMAKPQVEAIAAKYGRPAGKI